MLIQSEPPRRGHCETESPTSETPGGDGDRKHYHEIAVGEAIREAVEGGVVKRDELFARPSTLSSGDRTTVSPTTRPHPSPNKCVNRGKVPRSI